MSILTVRCLHHQACPQSQCLSWFGPLGTKLENTDGLRVQLEGEPGSGRGDPGPLRLVKCVSKGTCWILSEESAYGVTWLLSAREDAVLSHTLPQHCVSSGPSVLGHVLVGSGGVPSSHLCGIHVAPVCSWDHALSCMSNQAQASPGCVSQITG